jgi:hypothetical protein
MSEANLTADDPEPALERQRRAALRFQAERRRADLIRKRILGLRASNRTMPVKEIAFRVGVSAD